MVYGKQRASLLASELQGIPASGVSAMMPPCTRGLKKFEEAGCPERPYNYADGTGCPLWVEKETPTLEDPTKKNMRKMCVDRWTWVFQWSMLGVMEGNQTATETFRNAMCYPDPNDPLNSSKAWPKPDKAIMKLVEMIQEEQKNRQVIMQHEIQKALAEHGIGTVKDGKTKQLDHTCGCQHEVKEVSTTQDDTEG